MSSERVVLATDRPGLARPAVVPSLVDKSSSYLGKRTGWMSAAAAAAAVSGACVEGRAGRAWGCCEPWTGRCVFRGLGVSLEDGPGFSQVEKIVNYPGREEAGRGEGLLGLRMADSQSGGWWGEDK